MSGDDTNNTIWLTPLVGDQGFNLQFRVDHIHVKLGKGYRIDPEQGGAFWNMVRKACEKHDSRRVLVEGSIPAGETGTADVIEAGKRTAGIPKLWLAFCFEDFEPTGQSEIYAAIAASHGVRVKFFPDTERALKWLRQNSPR
jgi:hypothetical protein